MAPLGSVLKLLVIMIVTSPSPSRGWAEPSRTVITGWESLALCQAAAPGVATLFAVKGTAELGSTPVLADVKCQGFRNE